MRRAKSFFFLFTTALVFVSCSSSCESDKGQKTKDYFSAFKDRSYFDMWQGDIGANLPSVDRKLKPMALQILGHTIECSETACFDTFSKKRDQPITFTDPRFEETLQKRLTAYYLDEESQEYCAIEFLAFDRRVTFANYSKVLKALKKMNCEMRVVGAAKAKLPGWPKLPDDEKKRFKEIQTLGDAEQAEALEKWLASFEKDCAFVKKFRRAVKKTKREEIKKELLSALDDHENMKLIDECGLSSAQLITALRAQAFGFAKRSHDPFIKTITFAEGKEADIVVGPHLKTWGAFAKKVWAAKAAEPTVTLP